MKRSNVCVVLATAASLLLGCGSSGSSGDPSTTDANDGGVDGVSSDTPVDSPATDTGSRPDTASPPTDGAAPTRLPCLPRGSLATDLPLDVSGAFEGELVSLVPPGTGGGCPTDADHLHLQVAVGSKRYDVAVTIYDSPGGAPLAWIAKDLAAAPTVAPGWSSTVRLDFLADLGVHSGEFAPLAKTALLTQLETELASASAVRIFGRSYTDGTGLHNVHRNGGGHDGAIFVHHGSIDHVVALRFSTDTF